MSTAVAVVWRYWSWPHASAWGGGALAVLGAAWAADGSRTGGGLLAAGANAALLFYIVGGLSVIDNAGTDRSDREADAVVSRPWVLAAVPAAAALATLLPMRMIALATDVAGPWSGPGESALDVATRAAAVYAIVGLVGELTRRRRDADG